LIATHGEDADYEALTAHIGPLLAPGFIWDINKAAATVSLSLIQQLA
jgi:hypothetical protein